MEPILVYPVGTTKACQYCTLFLKKAGISLTDHPSPDITHLLLDVPSFQDNGSLRSGERIEPLLQMLPQDTILVGGNLSHDALYTYRKWDLLQDPMYLAENAAITADCAVRVAAKELPVTFFGCPILVIGWGRIGKCLAKLLSAMGAEVSVAARKPADLSILQALGYKVLNTLDLSSRLPQFRIIFNTVPVPVLDAGQEYGKDCLLVELASQAGINGSHVLQARGLPGIHAPESSGKLIANTILRYIRRR